MMKMITPTKEKKSYGDSDEDDEKELTSQQSSESTEKQQNESTVSKKKPSRKRMVSEINVSDISPMKTAIRTKTE